MRTALTLFTAAALAASPPAAVTVNVLLEDGPGSDLRTFTGAGDTNPRGLVRLSSGSFVFFEDIAGTLVADSLVLFDPDDPGGGVDRFEVIADGATLMALDPDVMAVSTDISLLGLVIDPPTEDLYALLGGSPGNAAFLARVPKAGGVGTDDYASPELFAASTAFPTFGLTFGHRLFFDPRPSPRELLIVADTGVSADDATINGLYTRPLTASPATAANTLVATFGTLAPALTPAPTVGTDDIGFRGLALIGAEDHVLHNAVGTAGSDGDWVLFDVSAGTASLWREDDLATGTIAMTNFPNGDIAALITSGGVSPFNDDLLRLDQSGNLVRLMATTATLTAPLASPSSNINVSAQAILAADDLTIFFFQSNFEEALVQVSDTEVPAELSAFFAD